MARCHQGSTFLRIRISWSSVGLCVHAGSTSACRRRNTGDGSGWTREACRAWSVASCGHSITQAPSSAQRPGPDQEARAAGRPTSRAARVTPTRSIANAPNAMAATSMRMPRRCGGGICTESHGARGTPADPLLGGNYSVTASATSNTWRSTIRHARTCGPGLPGTTAAGSGTTVSGSRSASETRMWSASG